MTKPNPWRDELERTMPRREDPVARNRAITARYAGWYLREPRFKWAAMAAFASSQAGDVLATRYAEGGGRLVRGARRGAAAILGAAVELIRETNAEVFDDVGWAHHAFLATNGDGRAIASLLADDPTRADVARGFLELAHAKALDERPDADEETRRAGRFAMWEGNRLLLRHEQIATVQPRFSAIPWAFRAYMTLLAVTPYEQLAAPPVRNTRFLPHALRRMRRTGRRADLPNMMDFDQRWGWIDQECFPLFREVEERRDPRMREVMERMASLWTPPSGQARPGGQPETSRSAVGGAA